MEYKWTALTVTTVGTLMSGVDARLVIIGLPTIASQLHAGAADVVWITQAYMLASAIGLFLIGRVTDLFGRVKMYNIGFVVFTVGSALSSIAQSPLELVIFRGVQGVGSGILVTNSAAIVTDASPKKELGFMIGINQTAYRIGSMAGLTLSGLILSVVDWRGLFYVNIPIGIFGTIWAHYRLREIATRDPSKKMDWIGFGLFSVGLTLLLVSITYISYGLSGYWVGVPFLFGGAALLIVFLRVESRSPSPILDLRLFKIRLFAAGNLAQLLNTLSWTGMLLLVAFYLQIGLGYSALNAGLSILPLEVVFLVSSLVNAKLSDRYGTRVLCTLGLAVNSISFATISTFGASTQYIEIAAALALVGIGNGMFISPNARAIMGSVPANRRGIASAFRQTMNNVGITTSYGLVILFVTIGIPYGTLSSLLEGSTVVQAAMVEFLSGFRIAALILAATEALAIIPSAMRGGRLLTTAIAKKEEGAEDSP